MDYVIREMRNEEFGLLGDFLYEAIYIPDGIEPPPKSVIECPELQEYIVGFGNRKHDGGRNPRKYSRIYLGKGYE